MTYEATTEGISVIDGVEVDITVRGDEDKASKSLMDLKERCGRIAQAYDEQTPPDEVELSNEYLPPMTVAWGRVLEE